MATAIKSIEKEIAPATFDFDEAEEAFINLDEVENRPVILGYNDFCAESDFPVWFACQSIHAAVKPVVSDEKRLKKIYIGLKEIMGDIEKHADKSDTAVVILHREIGGVALHTFCVEDMEKDHTDRWGEDPDHNSFGELTLKDSFGEDYTSRKDGDVFERHLFIWEDEESRQFPKIKHAA